MSGRKNSRVGRRRVQAAASAIQKPSFKAGSKSEPVEANTPVISYPSSSAVPLKVQEHLLATITALVDSGR